MKDSLSRAAWFRKAGYGIFYHYLSTTPGNTETPVEDAKQWRERTRNFDVEKVARQMHEIGAGYMYLTIGQNSGYYCSPNATLDRLTGRTGAESRCSDRDLISDLADALAVYNIPLMAYTTTMAPGFDHIALKKLEGVPPWYSINCGNYDTIKHLQVPDPRLKNFLRYWQDIHREWSSRWEKRSKAGGWTDGIIRRNCLLIRMNRTISVLEKLCAQAIPIPL